ncbi:TRAP transporter large permease [Virgibacillus byunsanensis]|uniref:TRAP transporter large permease n=1 Tax=Virgibacillus byunsanensis TaxID=570945 RepID=A0ABW3LJ57_9BACI
MISLGSILTLLGVLFLLLFLGVPIAFSLGLTGIVTIVTSMGMQYLSQIPLTLYGSLSEFIFVAIPLYVLMGEILYQGKSGERLFMATRTWFHKVRGGTGISSVLSYTFFAAIVGSSMTSVLTIGKIAIPEMVKENYSKKLSYGLSAIGGSLGILIPPSIPLIVYASLSGASPGKLFIAGIVPGVLIATLLIIWTVIKSPVNQSSEGTISKGHYKSTFMAIPEMLLPLIVLGGIYAGVFTPTEAAAVGVVYAFIITMLIHKSIKLKDLLHILIESVRTSSMLLMIVTGALIFGAALTLMGLPQFLSAEILGLDVSPWIVLLMMNIIWLLMGFFLEVVSIMLITTPIFFPIAMSLGFDPIWFGIIMVLNMELAVITPPIGMNLFAIKSLYPKEKMGTIIQGVAPYALFILFVLILVWVFPKIPLFLVE